MDELEHWLAPLGLAQLAPVLRANDVDLEILPELSETDLEKLGFSLGQRKKLLKAAASLPPPSSSAIPSAGLTANSNTASSAERRQLTVMFYDLVGSTALAAQHDPEDVREAIGAFHRCVGEAVVHFGGFVARTMGDGALVWFGYPQAHEDDAERAVRAGLAAVETVSGLTLLDGRHRPQLRIGIATGLVVVGEMIAASKTPEEDVVGETPNLAARLQMLAEPNGIVIAANTRQLLGTLFEYRDLGSVEAKGFARTVQAWQVLSESAAESRFEALHAALTPLVGRDEEVELLLRRWHRSVSGEGQVVLLAGEPGIGKSRILAAIQERIKGESHERLRYFCSPYHADSALYPIINQLEHAADFKREDAGDAKLGKLKPVLAPSSAEDMALFAELLSLPIDAPAPAHAKAEAGAHFGSSGSAAGRLSPAQPRADGV